MAKDQLWVYAPEFFKEFMGVQLLRKQKSSISHHWGTSKAALPLRLMQVLH